MGVTLSRNVTTSPVFLASAIIGFISFAVTVSTFLRVFWENLQTLFAAESEIHAYLSNLRIEIYEEKASLRQLRRHNRDFGHSAHKGKGRVNLRLDDMTIRSLQDVVRHLSRRFKTLEQPFLMQNDATGRRRSRNDTYARESGGWEDDLKGPRRRVARRHNSRGNTARGHHDDEEEEDDNGDDDGVDNYYCDITLAKRFVWLRRRGEAIDLSEGLSRLQTRRMARQIGELTVALYDYGGMIEDIRDDVEAMSGRMNRVVGIRRVD